MCPPLSPCPLLLRYVTDTLSNIAVARLVDLEKTTRPAESVEFILLIEAEPTVVQVEPLVETWAVKVLLLRTSRR